MGNRKLPHHCLIVRSYDEFRKLVQAYVLGAYELFVIVGGPGLGKSEIVKRMMQEIWGAFGWGLIKGKHSPLDLFERAWRYSTVPLVFDDLDDLLQKKENVMLLKCLCETQPVKRIEWSSRFAAFANGQLPRSFDSISRICLIANDWNSLDRNIAAVFDRGLVVLFQPTAVEVHREIARAGWFDDAEVFRFIGQNLFLLTEPSFRFYNLARDHKRAGLDWQALTLRTMETEADAKQILVARLLADSQCQSEAARIDAFRNHPDGGSRATYHRHKADLLARRGDLDAAEVAAIKLQPCKPDLHYLAQWDRRRQIEEARDRQREESMDVDNTATDAQPTIDVDPLERLQRQLDRAVARENFVQAARLRDEIRRLQQERGETGE